MEEETVGVEMDEEMDLEEPDGDGSEVEEEEEENVEYPGSSPLQQPSSGPGSTPTSTASSPPVSDDILPAYPFTGKPLSIRRGPGRPRKEGKPMSRSTKPNSGFKLKRFRTGYTRGVSKRVKSFDRADSDAASVPQSPSEDGAILDPETGALILASDKAPFSEEPYFPEQWPGKVCALCNLGERSQLGQGSLMRLSCPEGFNPTKKQPENADQLTSPAHDNFVEPERENGDKSPRGGPVAVTCRRQKSFNKCRNPALTNEYIDEFTIIGHIEQTDNMFRSEGMFYVHHSCAMWSSGVVKTVGGALDNVATVVSESISRKCSNCGHFGASLICRVAGCPRLYHFPCATAAGAFQDVKTTSMFCSSHLGQVPLFCDSSNEVTCMTCYALGDVSNLMFCSTCGTLHHGTCVGLAQLPGVRAGWQCKECKLCQICRTPGDDAKLMSCEQCDKAYHAHCLRPIVTSIPKYGWKCRCCRICGDCGSRTPGMGQSSRWHAHYTVCDSCYQQRNKGFSCPLCYRAYRAHAYREMVQCSFCRRFVHGTCDSDAELSTYQNKKEANPDYDYICPACKPMSVASRQMVFKRKDSIEDAESNYSGSQDGLFLQDDPYMLDFDSMSDKSGPDESYRATGLGKGKPYCASKIAKKRLGLGTGLPGRPKGVGKGIPGKFGHQKRYRFGDFGRKRGPKSKMRGIFGVPGVGLQRPVADASSKNDEEPGIENRLVLCSAKDKYVLTQDICVMCGALGTDQEGCLIACAQCGQCYHPYCVNINRVTKVILEKGWRCLDCTICEGCGQKNDEARLILCDDCDISYHIYCMDPPLEYVPSGTWKCKWCVMCQSCGAHDPGIGSVWMNSYSDCGPCASQNACCCCSESYSEGDLVINCVRCDRWLHGSCDSIKTEADAERCSEEGYTCVLCRPKDLPPPHLIPTVSPPKPPTPTKSPEIKIHSTAQYFVDGVYLSEVGLTTIKSLSIENHVTRKKRKKMSAVVDKEAGIMATIESVVAGSSIENSLEDTAKLELVDVKDEPQELYKEGMIWTPKTDGAPPEGFTIYTTETGVTLLRRKRQRNLQKLGIGGFIVRMRGMRGGQDNDDVDTLGQGQADLFPPAPGDPDKPKRKPIRRKPKGKIAENYPTYLQEAFFGRDLLDTVKEKEPDSGSGSDEDGSKSVTEDKIVHLSHDELKAIEAVKAKQDKDEQLVSSSGDVKNNSDMIVSSTTIVPKEEDDGSDSDTLNNVLTLPGDLIDNDLVNTIMNEDNEEMAAKNADNLESLAESNLGDDGDLTNSLPNTDVASASKDELTDILESHFNLEAIPNMNCKDVEEIFKGVLTDESQESQETEENMFRLSSPSVFSSNNTNQPSTISHPLTNVVRPQILPGVGQPNHNSPISFSSQSPYPSEYSNSPQFSPAFSEPPSPWVSTNDSVDPESSLPSVATTSYNQRSSEKMKVDEALGSSATISAVLYANMNYPEWKTEYPNWNDRCKQILKKWRALSSEKRSPYLQHARDNRSALRMKKAQQMNKDTASPTGSARSVTSVVAATLTSPPPVAPAAPVVLANTTPNIVNITKPPAAATVTGTTSAGQVEVCTEQSPQPKHPTQQLTIATALLPTTTITITPTTAAAVVVSTPTAILTLARPLLAATPSATTSASPPTQQQFTVHGQFVGLHNHTGPAPNVTVNPHYQPPERPASPAARVLIPVQPPPAADQQIRVLTPSEIMRTLPSLCQDTYDLPVSQPSMDQDKLSQQQKTVREQEQERQWKQLQAYRQQQAQQQQQVIHDQRVQAIARVQRQITEGAQQFTQDQNNGLTNQLQVSTSQELSPAPSPSPRQFVAPGLAPGMKGPRPMSNQSPTFQHPSLPAPRAENIPVRPMSLPLQRPVVRTPMQQQPSSPFSPQPVQSPLEYAPARSPQSDAFQRPLPESGDYIQPSTPRPQFAPGQQSPSAIRSGNFQPRLPADPYAQQPSTPRPQFTAPRPTQAGFTQGLRQPAPIENPEMNRHLRDLLQRQQFKKLDDQLLPGKQRVWPPTDGSPVDSPAQFDVTNTGGSPQSPNDGTFRHPLPPGMARPRAPLAPNGGVLIRQPGVVGLRMPNQPDPRMMGMDPRMRLMIQQRAVNSTAINQQFQQTSHILNRAPSTPRPADSYDQMVQRQHLNFQIKQEPQSPQSMNSPVNVTPQNLEQQQLNLNKQNVNLPTVVSSSSSSSGGNAANSTETQEIPDNVTAELEKLEQENGGMVEVEGVGDILGLGEDDDGLLDEMGADFNILEYADPELDALAGGEKTNILDSLDLEEPEPDEKKESKQLTSAKPVPMPPTSQSLQNIANNSVSTTNPPPLPRPQQISSAMGMSTETSSLPTPVQQQSHPVSEQQPSIQQAQVTNLQVSAHQQQIQQHMQQQVQQAAAMGRPMPPGTRLMSPDGAVGIVTNNNGVTVSYPPNYPQRIAQTQILQNQRIQMRIGPGGVPRMVSVGPSGPILHPGAIGLGQPRMSLPPPPPPPYPGPPPPYPGQTTTQMGLRGIGAVHHLGPPRLPLGLMHHLGPPQALPVPPHMQRRPLLLQEQPLLLEDLLEQEKREQEKQLQNQPQTSIQEQPHPASNNALLTDQDFEKLRPDVFRTVSLESPPQGLPAQGLLPASSVGSGTVVRQQFVNRPVTQTPNSQWQQTPRPPTTIVQPGPVTPIETAAPRTPTFTAALLPAPPLPPEHIVTEQDRQTQQQYERWLHHQNSILSQQLKFYETEVQKLRKIRKSLNSKQRQLKKSGNQLAECDALELKRISAEQAILQKQLESSRKQNRQHGLLIQEYRNKQQAKEQRQTSSQSPLMMNQQSQSPLGPPGSSPIHPTPQSPLMSPTGSSPMTVQHNSPLHSPAPLVSPSPGPGSVSSVLQSPGNNPNSSMSPLGMQPSPRIGTPHSQGEANSPGPVQSPSHVCPPPPAPRMTSPQHRRLVTSPLGYTQTVQQNRFIRPQTNVVVADPIGLQQQQQQRPRLQLQAGAFQQVIRPSGPSPLGSPQPGQQQQIGITAQQHQQLLQQKQQQLQQQVLLQQQQLQQLQNGEGNQQAQIEAANALQQTQRTLQMIQQRQLFLQQQQNQQLVQQRQQQLIQQQQQNQQLQQQQQQLQQQQQQQQQQLQQQQLQQQQLQQQQIHQQQLQQQMQQQNVQQIQQQNVQQMTQQNVQQMTQQQLHHQQMLQQQQQLAKQQQLAAQQGGRSPMQQPPSSPMPPRSPMIQNQQMMSPHHSIQQPQSPMPPKSPLILGYSNQNNQPPSSPMPRSPMLHQPPSSPMLQQQLNQHHGNMQQTPTSPHPRSPMLNQMPSPMGIRRPPSTNSSPAIPDRPQSVENPGTPRTPYSENNESGGGTPHPGAPIPFCPGFGRYGYFKLGLRGGSPMWNFGRGPKRPPTLPQNLDNTEKAGPSDPVATQARKESHLSKVSILKKKPSVKPAVAAQTVAKIPSLVCADYNEFDDSSSTPPVTPPPSSSNAVITAEKKILQQKAEKKINEEQQDHDEVMMIDSSPDEKQDMHCDALVDYDYDNDKTLVTTEVSLSSVAQQVDADEITVIESFAQEDLGDVVTSPLETEVTEEYVLFPSDMVVAMENAVNLDEQEFHEKDDDDEEYEDDMINIDGKNVEIVAIQSPTSSDEEMIKRGKTRKIRSEALSLNLHRLRNDRNQMLTDTPESPDQEEMNVDPSPEPFFGESEIVIIDPNMKSPEEHIATKEDFEELIDGEKRDEKIHIPDAMFSAVIHKYTAGNVFNFIPKTSPPSYQQAVSSPLYSQSSNASDTNSNSATSSKENNTVTIVATPILSPVVSISATKTTQEITSITPVTRITVANISSPVKIITSIVQTNNLQPSLATITSGKTIPITSLAAVSAVNSIIDSVSKTTEPSVLTEKVIYSKKIFSDSVSSEKVTFEKKMYSPSLSLNTQISALPNKIFEDECTSPDESICQDDLYSPIRKSFTADSLKLSETESENETSKDTVKEAEIVEDEKKNGNDTEGHTAVIKDIKAEEKEETPEKVEEPTKLETVKAENTDKIPELQNAVTEKIPEQIHFTSNANLLAKEIVIQNVSKTQEKCSIGNICVAQRDGQIETIPASFITHTDLDDNNSDLASKSVVISIPSPTPSQEQMLDNIAMQELVETRRRDGKTLPSEFESIEDVLNMIENITGEQPTVIEDKIETAKKEKSISSITMSLMESNMDIESGTPTAKLPDLFAKEVEKTPTPSPKEIKIETPAPIQPHPITVATTSTKSTVMPQLSPLSQPTELTTNMANVSQQLRTLLSSLHTNTVTTTTNVESLAKPTFEKEKIIPIVTTATVPLTTSTSTMALKFTTQVPETAVINTTAIPTNIINKPRSSPSIIAVTTAAKLSPIRTQSPMTLQNFIQSTNANLIVPTSSITVQPQLLPTSLSSLIQSNKPSSGGIQLMPDHPKLPLITTVMATPALMTTMSNAFSSSAVSTILTSVSSPLTTSAISSAISSAMSSVISPSLTMGTTHTSFVSSIRKSTPSLNAMLQSHPAATVPQSIPGTITAASLLGMSRSSAFSSANQLIVSSAAQTVKNLITSSFISSSSPTLIATTTTPKPIVSTTNLLHTQLTKAPLKRSKSIDDPSSSAHHFIKKEELPHRSDSLDDSSQVSSSGINIKQELALCKYSSMQSTRTEDSQNVLLKQLLQNTGCASTQSSNTPVTHTAPNLPIVPSLEAQLARPVPPTPSSLLPPLLQNDAPISQANKITPKLTQIISRETSFVSRPPQKSPTIASVSTQQQLQIDIKKCLPPSRTPSRDELLSPPTPRSSGGGSQESSLQTPPLVIKKEATTTVPFPSPVSHQGVPTLQEVKKELIDESSQHSEISDQGRSDLMMPTKEESTDAMDMVNDKMLQDQAALELKKIKRRVYQQKRRQNQIMSKDLTGQPKKRQRKSSKLEEDYDTFVENLMVQLRQLPPMTVTEPVLGRNYSVCALYGSGELGKVSNRGYDSRCGELVGHFGDSIKPETSNYYDTKPYGEEDPLPEKPPASTQRLFYDQEFPPIKFDTDDDRRLELFCRDNDTPDSIVSSSSPECSLLDPPIKFTGLRLIKDDDDDSDDMSSIRMSPIIPIIAPIPIRLKPSGPYLKDYADMDKENLGSKDSLNFKSRFPSSNHLKDTGNVTVTLTLTSSAAEDIMGVLRDLANILHIPAPTSYQIIERTSTPPSHKLGLYRTKGKDGKEGAPIDIQSILNGAAKFCRHCDVVILNNLIRKRISELPFLYKEPDLLGDGDELYFCSSTCYMQFALMHRSPTMTQDKAAAIVDHLCQDKAILKKRELLKDPSENFKQNDFEKMDVDEIVNTIKSEYNFNPVAIKKEFKEIKSTESLELSPQRAKKLAPEEPIQQPPAKIWKGSRFKYYAQGVLQPKTKYKRPSEKEIMEMMFRLGVTVLPSKIPDDTRKCMFCHMTGDAVADGPARLLNFDVDKWVHLNCALWSEGVYETVNGALMNLENALQQSLSASCINCQQPGATIHCFKVRCSNIYHLGCAVKDGCMFYKDKTTYCATHIPKNEKDNELTTLSVSRRVYVQRDENRQVATVMHQSDHNNLLRVGSLIFLNVGQLLPHQLQNFHTSNYIYPIGYKIIRFYWSMRRINKRCRYVCSIHDASGRPEFRVLVQEPTQDDVELRDNSPRSVWTRILEPLASLRKEHNCVQLYPQYVTGEDLFGLTEPAVVRVLESLPGIETLSDYRFKYGRNPLLELPLAINPSGAARSEPRLRNQFPWKRPHTQRTGSSARPVFVPTAAGAGEAACPYSKQFVHSKSSQYKKMKQEWRNNVYLARSKIQGLGLYAARDLEKHTMVIEYIGEIIRTELAETREKQYEARNRGIYMFRLDEERVVDATLSGGLARYINHSCNPNCVAEIVEVDRDLRIIIFAKRRIARGEELAYDYKFDIEDDQHKISCMCGAPNCRKWMN